MHNKRPRRCWNTAEAFEPKTETRGARWLQARTFKLPAESPREQPRRICAGNIHPFEAEKVMIAETTSNAAPAKGYIGLGMEGFIASWYAGQTLKDIDVFRDTARRLSSQIERDSRVLEVAPGPGYLAIELAKLTGCRMIGLDISRTFVRIATENAEKAGTDVCFEQGDAADLPYPANVFDFIVCRAAFKNFARPLAALDEMHRVLKPGGTALIIDLRKDFSSRDVSDFVKGKGFVNAALIRLIFNTMLKKRAYTREAILRLASQSRFQRGDLRLDSVGFELWLRKPAHDAG
jgi:ubiquinone/menaquinone biosynthesis C-methylase UbiE